MVEAVPISAHPYQSCNWHGEKEGWDNGFAELVLGEEGAYVPTKVGRVDRLLMKLDFGGWFDVGKKDAGDLGFGDDSDYEI